MIICSCNAISDTSVKASIHSEKCPRTPGAVYRCLGCKPCCGRCFVTVRAIIDEAMTQAGAPAGETAGAAATSMTVARLDQHRHMHAHETAHAQTTHAHEAGACADTCEACAAAAA